LENIYNSWLNNQDYYPELTSPQLKSYYKNLLAGLSLPAVPLGETGETQYGHFFSFSVGCLYIWSDRHYTDAEIKILKRFAGIIDLTFRRYLDLQKAEIQAKEAQIQAALERIRGKAMAMHTTQDLSDTIGSFYHELQSFSLTPIRCGVGLLEKEERLGELYTWYTTEKGQSLELVGRLKMEGHPVLNKIYEGWLSQTEYHPVLRGNEIKEYYKILKPQMNFPDFGYDEVQFGYFFFFPEGGVYAWMEKEMQENELQIYRRFTSVLSLTYKRYRDLEKAEANAKEAVKQSALDRIRADIASMRTTQDLERITPLIWNELTILGVPFIRCGVFIMDETQQLIHSFLSTPEGKAIASFELPYDSAGELSDVLAYWRKNEIFKDHWDETKFTHWTKGLVEHGAITSEEKYSTAHAPVNLHLHFLPFLQGMLYVGSEVPLTTEEIRLAQTLADAFSTAYARYEDFNKLEAAKAQIEKTLTELRQAQAQLIQSEKMASLGELTAGIAHEIQNPLNFVNNFSEVNKEMLEELKAERLKPNTERDESLQDELINDVIENSEKINHHGKRADAIVKGMLQHSRVSSGQKEPTDINALADEYLRLSYHGLRAKDKNFNAIIETDFDKSIGKINVIPQEIGRVLLNLFNNAFYAVNEQKSLNPVSYKPTVSVKTENCDDKIYITVRDNGNGIPQKIIDKVFQPFFTTKPTGQGTGLGLSLSYDIIKAHGGEIKVESKEGEGSEFIIQLSDL
jgi:signal transduction histidine kinase